MDSTPLPWSVLRAETGIEPTVTMRLAQRDFEAYTPTYTQEYKYFQRRPQIRCKALFPGYIFARFTAERKVELLQVPGVIDVLAFGHAAAVVEHAKIEDIRRLADSGVAEAFPVLMVGSHVTVRLGPFAGVSGILSEIKNKLRVVVNIEILRRALAVEVDRQAISAW